MRSTAPFCAAVAPVRKLMTSRTKRCGWRARAPTMSRSSERRNVRIASVNSCRSNQQIGMESEAENVIGKETKQNTTVAETLLGLLPRELRRVLVTCTAWGSGLLVLRVGRPEDSEQTATRIIESQ
jgi:hypothetical protein